MVSFGWEIFLLCLNAAMLTSFIAGLLFYLCLEHVDNLGAYTASRPESVLIITSDFSRWFLTCPVPVLLHIGVEPVVT
jgi:uncharacterized membrane protein YraQ (UPF0718 family)